MKLADPASSLVTGTEAPALPTMTSRIDPDSAARIMDMLINAYSDQRLAVVRENVSNAVDATRRAGSTEPVQITSPTLIEPNFVVTDRGTGMSAAEVEAAFLTFGGSTKRHTDDEIGGYGVGAKSPWSLTESFLIDTAKDGKRTLVRASRDLNHQVLMLDEPTSLPNGTTISIPVDVEGHASDWARVIREVSIAHDSGMIEVDGSPAASIADSPTWIGPVSCARIPGREHDQVIIRSGGTLFAATRDVARRVLDATGLMHCIIELPIGSFDHSLTRETATTTDRTLAAVDAALASYATAYAALEARVNELASRDVYAAVTLRNETLGEAGRPNHLRIEYRMGVPEGIGAWNCRRSSGYSSRQRWMSADTHHIEDRFAATSVAGEMRRTLVVTDVPKGRKLRGFATWIRDNHPSITRVVPVPEGQTHILADVVNVDGDPTGQTWKLGADTDGVTHYSFAEWAAELRANRKPSSRATGYLCQVIAIDGETAQDAELTGQEIVDLGLPVCYVTATRPSYPNVTGPAVVVVYLGRRKVEPLLKAVPTAVTQSRWNQMRFEKAIAGMTHLQMLAAASDHGYGFRARGRYIRLADAVLAARPDHPLQETLQTLVAVRDADKQVTAAQREAFGSAQYSDRAQELAAELNGLQEKLTAAYPLLANMPYNGGDDVLPAAVDYMVHTPPRS